jgi:hypothetical protein
LCGSGSGAVTGWLSGKIVEGIGMLDEHATDRLRSGQLALSLSESKRKPPREAAYSQGKRGYPTDASHQITARGRATAGRLMAPEPNHCQPSSQDFALFRSRFRSLHRLMHGIGHAVTG